MALSDYAQARVPADERLTDSQVDLLVALERIGGSVSLVSVLLIFVAYALERRVRNVQNTFIVFASVSNVGASIASIIAFDGLSAGKASPLCQAQSFMFEMFMQSDPWWSLAMAVNVFLVFYFRTSPDSFQKWWWLYCMICYGGPFLIALALLVVRNNSRGPVYGSAVIWCWVDQTWDDIRIYTYYMLIWICIAGSLLFYFMVGYHVFHSRNQLRSLSASRNGETSQVDLRDHNKPPGYPRKPYYGTVVTEVQVTHTAVATASTLPCPEPLKQAHLPPASLTSFENSSPSDGAVGTSATATAPVQQYFSEVTSAPPAPVVALSPLVRLADAHNTFLSKFVIEDPIKRAYLRTSFLFALSVLVTWIPSSLNRINSWLRGESPIEYHVATAAVLPLQGLWNAVIFFVTSAAAIRSRLRDDRGEAHRAAAENARDAESASAAAVAAAARRRTLDGDRIDSDMEDADSGLLGSDVELRRMAESPGKRSLSL